MTWEKNTLGWLVARWRGWTLFVWPCFVKPSQDAEWRDGWGYSVTQGFDPDGGAAKTSEEAKAAAENLLRTRLTGHERAAFAQEAGQ